MKSQPRAAVVADRRLLVLLMVAAAVIVAIGACGVVSDANRRVSSSNVVTR